MFTRLIQFNPNQTLLLKGPAEITVEDGRVTALGKPLMREESATVRRGKIMPFEAADGALVKVTLRGDADYLLDSGRVGVRIWRSVLDNVFAEKCRKVVIVGETDSGKSTLSTYLLNTALSKGLTAGVIDEDVGQGDLAPPGCIGGRVLRGMIFDLRDLEAEFFGFVGAVSPRGVREIILDAIGKVRRRLEEAGVDFYVVNTDGYAAYEGVVFKAEIICEVNPDVVVCFEDSYGGRTLYNRLRDVCSCNIVLAERPAYSSKSLSERIRRRISQYHRFIKGGQILRIDLKRLAISFLGRTYHVEIESEHGSEVAKGDGVGNSLVLRARSFGFVEVSREESGFKTVLGLDSLKGMFLGLGSGGEVSGFGRCVEVHPGFTIEVLTSEVRSVDTVFLSLIRLQQDERREYILPVMKSSSLDRDISSQDIC